MEKIDTALDQIAKGDERLKPRRRWPRSVRLTIMLVLYVFSIGPMFWVWYEAENMGGNPFVRVVYAPLRLLCAIPQVEAWLNNYINWWIA